MSCYTVQNPKNPEESLVLSLKNSHNLHAFKVEYDIGKSNYGCCVKFQEVI